MKTGKDHSAPCQAAATAGVGIMQSEALLFLFAGSPTTRGSKASSGLALGTRPGTALGQSCAPLHQGHETSPARPITSLHPGLLVRSAAQKAPDPTLPPGSSRAKISSHPSALSNRPPRGGKHFSNTDMRMCREEEVPLHCNNPAPLPRPWSSSWGMRTCRAAAGLWERGLAMATGEGHV